MHSTFYCEVTDMAVDISTLQTSIVTDLSAELSGEAGFSLALLQNKVKLAILDVMARREYGNTRMKDEAILAELSTRYYATIENLARYDYNQIGLEGEIGHSEDSVNRSWIDRNKLLCDVHPFVKVI